MCPREHLPRVTLAQEGHTKHLIEVLTCCVAQPSIAVTPLGWPVAGRTQSRGESTTPGPSSALFLRRLTSGSRGLHPVLFGTRFGYASFHPTSPMGSCARSSAFSVWSSPRWVRRLTHCHDCHATQPPSAGNGFPASVHCAFRRRSAAVRVLADRPW